MPRVYKKVLCKQTTAKMFDAFWLEDSKEKYYVLGYLFADGNISGKGWVTAASVDKGYLKQIADISGGKYHIGNSKMATISFGGVMLAEYLGYYGLIQRKSNIKKFPSNIPSEYLRDFIRGEFDGDGWIRVVHRNDGKGWRYSFGISSGSMDFLLSLQMELLINGIDGGKIREQVTEWGHSISLNYIGLKRLKEIRSYLYYDGCLCLQRKLDKFLLIQK